MTQEMRERRPYHAERSAESHAAFLLPHLRPGMDLLDLGCGPGSITVGLAAAVAPGRTTGVDVDPVPVAGVTIVRGDAMSVPFPDASFDAIYAGALLQHLADPLAALREARRVARPGAVIGVVDADWDGEIMYPTNEVLQRSTALARRLRQATSPFVGKQLRHLLTEAGFSRCEGSARVVHHGTPEEAGGVGRGTAGIFRSPAIIARLDRFMRREIPINPLATVQGFVCRQLSVRFWATTALRTVEHESAGVGYLTVIATTRHIERNNLIRYARYREACFATMSKASPQSSGMRPSHVR